MTDTLIPYFSGDANIIPYDERYNLDYEMTIEVSDHYPVYAVFSCAVEE